MRNTGKREAKLLVLFAKSGVHPIDLDKMVVQELSKEINRLWDARTPNGNLKEIDEKIDELQRELTALRTAEAGPVVLPKNWCESDGQWWI